MQVCGDLWVSIGGRKAPTGYHTDDWDKMEQELKQLQALTKEFAEGIVDNFLDGYGGYSSCTHCYTPQIDGIVNHKDDCLVFKAQQYLDSLKE